MCLRDVCNELRKLYMQCCGFRHEDWSINPSKQPCGDADESYNVVCNHSKANGVFWQAWLASKLIGKGREGEALFTRSHDLHTEIDDIDSHCRPLYQLAADGTTSQFRDPGHSFTRLVSLGVATDAHAGESAQVCSRLCGEQEKRGRQLLAIRDQYLQLLGA